ncbi:hypothetical protein PTKIN_Ptkin07bG0108100 [Pterospermum kingtungense]
MNSLTNTDVGAKVTHSFSTKENTIIVGTQHALGPLTMLKARLNNAGKASALIQHEWHPGSLITISGEIDTKSIDKSAKEEQLVHLSCFLLLCSSPSCQRCKGLRAHSYSAAK